VMAPYSDGGPAPGVVRALDFVHVMSGGAGASGSDVPWLGLLVSLTMGAIAMRFAFHRSATRDF
jgi:hypothetical protein